MKFQSELAGRPNGSVHAATLRKHAAYLCSEHVNGTHAGQVTRSAILLEYRSDEDSFYFRFSPLALRFLEEVDDPRLDRVIQIFSGINPTLPSDCQIEEIAHNAGVHIAAIRRIDAEFKARQDDLGATIKHRTGELAVRMTMKRLGVRFLPRHAIQRFPKSSQIPYVPSIRLKGR